MGWKKELWPEWQIECDIGCGAYGKVYKIKRQDMSGVYYSALKVISFPRNRNEYLSMKKKHMSDEQISEYYHQRAIEVAREVAVMEKLKGHTNIVTYEDHKIVQNKDGLGWDVLIRMELLKSLPKYLETKEINEKEVCKLGIDICSALILCEKEKIIHRDIKPENIFVSEFGDYKLGDFSLAKHVEWMTESLKPQGTYAYMAPEVYKRQKYDFTIDIYSLGLILYRLLNRGRGPFQPLPPESLSSEILENANKQRLYSETMPKPIDASPLMASIISKACAYDSDRRYKNAYALQKALIHCSSLQGAMNATKQISFYVKKVAAAIGDSGEDVDGNATEDDEIVSVYTNDDNSGCQEKNKAEKQSMSDYFTTPGDL